MTNLGVVVAQLGARQHYAIPQECLAHGALVRLHTDFWNPLPTTFRTAAARLGGSVVRRLVGRQADIPDRFVRTHAVAAIRWQLRLRQARDRIAEYDAYVRWGQEFAIRVARALDRERFTTFFGFSSASLEALQRARELGALCVVDEIAPTHLEDEIVADELERFPNWEPSFRPTPPQFLDRLQSEWEVADRIVVNSQWTQKALGAKHVAMSKIHVVPISYQARIASIVPRSMRANVPLKILWLGTLCLRKGLPYALEAARLLQAAPVHFTFAGPSPIDLSKVSWPQNATYVGQVPRAEAQAIWADHDVFMLPTLSDGFAITQIEALAHGLPVITTPNCGEVVEHGLNGLVVPPRDPKALADAILTILDGGLELEAASYAAIARAKDFLPAQIWPRLRAALTL